MRAEVLKTTAKAGYTARAIVYFIVGGFAVLAALGPGGDTTNSKGALLKLFDTGYGAALITIVAAGLLCFALWRLFQGVMNTDNHSNDIKGLLVRGGLLVSFLTYATLGFWALSAVWGEGSNQGSGTTAWLMHQPYGPWMVAAVGIAIVGAGIAHIHKGATRGYAKWFTADAWAMRFICPVSTTGLIARGVVLLIIGGLFIYAGITVDAEKAGGLREALEWLQDQPFGAWLFLIAALGLVCFGAYSLIEARYRRIQGEDQLPDI